ncbi:hypothetical protein M407DRAFT_241506 [Tulasnella calospora MUT 4182]|uniref:Mitochondrial import inner membrane translocase subunit TIM16 n=1 Tax=Tulasnella calospora MUT 4182 TaxID=1051891 RepID=A0A0C3QJ42_9AGAM|nr:hypothetical protein M407DRAFT_241506 [Tulasnella calospora MUT 4182]
MSSPRVIVQVAIAGAQILGRAFLAAGRQAVANAKHRQGAAEEAAGVQGTADNLTQTHRMTVDEAHLILNAKRGDPLSQILQNYEVLFKANSPPEAPTAQATAAAGARRKGATQRFHSHYIQSKVVRAKERIEAELEIEQEAENAQRAAEQPTDSTNAPPPPNPPPSS